MYLDIPGEERIYLFRNWGQTASLGIAHHLVVRQVRENGVGAFSGGVLRVYWAYTSILCLWMHTGLKGLVVGTDRASCTEEDQHTRPQGFCPLHRILDIRLHSV
jgi:hypothetical protein